MIFHNIYNALLSELERICIDLWLHPDIILNIYNQNMVLTIIFISIFTLQTLELASDNGNSNLYKIYNRYTAAKFTVVDSVSLA